eukprot:TRINITY_DN37712_c0_g1_i1.p1 TRINITY_DN37712_c0_g1~~TRINITY_DN37712_c0_g1_i1.p1  ORF type:complete len:288 (-),score=33.53 TRINITY_DN37712_c0_g1_i1:438-1256(-)
MASGSARRAIHAAIAARVKEKDMEDGQQHAMSDKVLVIPERAKIEQGDTLESDAAVTYVRAINLPKQDRNVSFTRVMINLPEPDDFLTSSRSDVEESGELVPVPETRLTKRDMGIADVSVEQGGFLEIYAAVAHPRVNNCPKPDKAVTCTRTMANIPDPKEFLSSSCVDFEGSDESVSGRGAIRMEPHETEISLHPEVGINLAARSKRRATWSHGCSTCTLGSDFDDDAYDQSKRLADFSSLFPGALNVARARNLQRHINMDARSRRQSSGA